MIEVFEVLEAHLVGVVRKVDRVNVPRNFLKIHSQHQYLKGFFLFQFRYKVHKEIIRLREVKIRYTVCDIRYCNSKSFIKVQPWKEYFFINDANETVLVKSL